MKNPHVLLTDPAQIASAESIVRLDEKGYLYHMRADWNYLDIPEMFKPLFNAGCSVFVTRNLEGEPLFCRSYDYSHYLNNDKVNNPRTGLNAVVHCASPAARFKSVGVADLFWVDYKLGRFQQGCPDDGVTDVSPFIMAPHLCMDGMNEKGLAVCILALPVEADWNEIPYEEAKEKQDPLKTNFALEKAGELPDPKAERTEIGSVCFNEADRKAWICSKRLIAKNEPGRKLSGVHTTLMRLMLDNCSTVEEALALAGNFNVIAPAPGMDFHIMVADASGAYKLIEWRENEMLALDIDHATNFFVSREDRFGAGYDRDEVIKAGLGRCEKAGMREDFAENVMQLITQDPSTGNDLGKTQWTCIYNLSKKTVKVFSFGDFSRSWNFTVEE